MEKYRKNNFKKNGLEIKRVNSLVSTWHYNKLKEISSSQRTSISNIIMRMVENFDKLTQDDYESKVSDSQGEGLGKPCL